MEDKEIGMYNIAGVIYAEYERENGETYYKQIYPV